MITRHFHSTRGCLSYLTYDESSKEGALIDPSSEIALEEYTRTLQEEGVTLTYLIETHTHADHVSSLPELKQLFPNARSVRHGASPSRTADMYIEQDITELPLGASSLTILSTPGHTNESISIYNGREVFTGDTLLIGGTGRTDFQVGNSEHLYESIHEKIADLPHDTLVRPGHNYQNKHSSVLLDELHTSERLCMCKDAFITYMNAYHPQKPELFELSLEKNSR